MTANTAASPVIAVVVVETEEAGLPASQVTLLRQDHTATPMGYHRNQSDALAAAAALERLLEAGTGHAQWLKHGFDLKLIAPGCYAASKTVGDFEFLVSDEKESLALPAEGPLTIVAYGPGNEDTGFIREAVTLAEVLSSIDHWARALSMSHG